MRSGGALAAAASLVAASAVVALTTTPAYAGDDSTSTSATSADRPACDAPDVWTETFGAGTGRAPLPDGQTTYTYRPTGEIKDGQYALVHNVGRDAGTWWHAGPDHTGDENGRKLVINADKTQSGAFYTTQIDGLTPGETYYFSGWVANAGSGGAPVPVNVRFAVRDAENEDLLGDANSGDLPATNPIRWGQYGAAFVAPASGSVNVVASNNGLGGQGNDLYVDDLALSVYCPDIELTKNAEITTDDGEPGMADAGDVITYTFTVENTGNIRLENVTVNDPMEGLSEISPAGPVSLDPGASATFTATYTVTEEDMDGEWLSNTATATGTAPEGEISDEDSAEVRIYPGPGILDTWKTVNPASGSSLQSGETVTYTLHFENSGGSPVAVDHDDVLSGVLDDAEITKQPVASGDGLTVSDIVDGRFTVAGEVAPGQTVTVSYKVTVREEGQRGDDRLGNFLVPAGEEPPASCVPTNPERPDCTVNDVSYVSIAKSSDPESGTKVDVGDEITYTLTLKNPSVNSDAAGVSIDYTDHMADVLDDATLTEGPTVSSENIAATVDGDTIRITGTVPTGDQYTVTYTVTVNAYEDQGDRLLSNIVSVTGEDPVCVDGSPLCTIHEGETPPIPATPLTPATPADADEPRGFLPVTGSDIYPIVALASLLLLAGGGMFAFSRRRKS